MKILVIADTRGSVGPILTAIDRENPDVLIHLGNGISDLKDIKFKGQLYAVKGLFDFNTKLKSMAKLSYNKTVILYVNGHDLGVNQNYNKLIDFANAQGANIVLFGNTCKADYFERDGKIFVNPGGMHTRSDATYVTITLSEEKPPVITHHRLLDEK